MHKYNHQLKFNLINKTAFIAILTTFAGAIGHAQVAIGKEMVTTPSVSLDFGDTEARGLLLPWVDSTTNLSEATNGTLVFDRSDHKVKVKYENSWKDLSIEENGTLDSATQPTTENENAQVRIGGTETDSTAGILVLADTDKAMVLPKVSDTDDIINPTAGMMVYVTSKPALAVFNGSVWTFWKY